MAELTVYFINKDVLTMKNCKLLPKQEKSSLFYVELEDGTIRTINIDKTLYMDAKE